MRNVNYAKCIINLISKEGLVTKLEFKRSQMLLWFACHFSMAHFSLFLIFFLPPLWQKQSVMKKNKYCVPVKQLLHFPLFNRLCFLRGVFLWTLVPPTSNSSTTCHSYHAVVVECSRLLNAFALWRVNSKPIHTFSCFPKRKERWLQMFNDERCKNGAQENFPLVSLWSASISRLHYMSCSGYPFVSAYFCVGFQPFATSFPCFVGSSLMKKTRWKRKSNTDRVLRKLKECLFG